MNNNDYTWYFIIMSILNTNIGLSNVSKNQYQADMQNEINKKLDKILSILGDKNE